MTPDNKAFLRRHLDSAKEKRFSLEQELSIVEKQLNKPEIKKRRAEAAKIRRRVESLNTKRRKLKEKTTAKYLADGLSSPVWSSTEYQTMDGGTQQVERTNIRSDTVFAIRKAAPEAWNLLTTDDVERCVRGIIDRDMRLHGLTQIEGELAVYNQELFALEEETGGLLRTKHGIEDELSQLQKTIFGLENAIEPSPEWLAERENELKRDKVFTPELQDKVINIIKRKR
jgi:hypothetical protein